ncbi:glycosyl transferase family 2 [Lapidilactobacillus concavus DSM 17758]|uniref:Glycosyl transferase family 2 n=1 Tax=Lapidilactobacillus concavus DSM 17758 TaxID=1423735 RepID=A0A0R1W025_9LACO|nr:glycosyltransferase family 2 protein [Lapidilactobacillus concavus]KRM08691.1 glycosyl transferase family 2 [Lapidilactobacillus concavus DSM 17758]GEL13683.1 glycosyl transferase [Lapidilactobacillus concavus]
MDFSNYDIAILMSTYNAEKYLSEQIESIIKQDTASWRLYIRDDGSTDKTCEIISRYAQNNERIIFINENSRQNLGVTRSFLWLLKNVSADFYMFCDQDDYWLSTKVRETLQEMLAQQYEDIPVLVHSDLEVVDANLELIASSFFERQGLPKNTVLTNLVVQNNVTGCTVMVNQKLKQSVAIVSDKVIIHDWWLALIATCLGKVVFVDKPLIKYRQHGNNVIGSSTVFSKFFSGYVQQIRDNLVALNEQNAEFKNIFESRLNDSQEKVLTVGSKFMKQSSISRYFSVKHAGIYKIGKVRNLLFYCLLLILPKYRGGNDD